MGTSEAGAPAQDIAPLEFEAFMLARGGLDNAIPTQPGVPVAAGLGGTGDQSG